MSKPMNLSDPVEDQLNFLQSKLIGQENAFRTILPYLHMYRAGICPERRPVGVFMLLGPTGTGKTRTVEILSEALHGGDNCHLRIDCGEFQLEHEVARLIGAPPGYLGHRETQPLLSQSKLNACISEHSNLSIVLLDEIEKAASSFQRILLGVTDRAVLSLGDNAKVNFERSMIFMTSNLGAKEMLSEPDPAIQHEIGMRAVRNHFSPEFINRIDGFITYRPLDSATLGKIIQLTLQDLQHHLNRRLGARSFRIKATEAGLKWLLNKGSCQEYGAREIKRTVLRNVTHPIAMMLNAGKIEPGCRLTIDVDESGRFLELVPSESSLTASF